jgi:hypothetical protein
MERYELQQEINKNDRQMALCLKGFVGLLVLGGLCWFGMTYFTHFALGMVRSIGLRGEFLSFMIKMNSIAQLIESKYSFVSYGSDILGLMHLMLALLFVGPLTDAAKNIWVIQFGMLLCIAFLPASIVSGLVRGVPFVWCLVAILFAVLGFVLLFVAHKMLKANDVLQKKVNDLNVARAKAEIRVA